MADSSSDGLKHFLDFSPGDLFLKVISTLLDHKPSPKHTESNCSYHGMHGTILLAAPIMRMVAKEKGFYLFYMMDYNLEIVFLGHLPKNSRTKKLKLKEFLTQGLFASKLKISAI